MPLTSKTFDLLLALVENHGREITKEELMERVWGDQIVEDGNLTVTMSYVRKALGEKVSDHRFIVTIPGHGYRFVAQVMSLDDQREFIIESKTASQVTIEQEISESDENSIGRGKLFPPAELKKAIPLSGDSPDEPAELARAYALAGKRDEALKIVNALRQTSKHKHVARTVMAAIYGALGDKTQAFAFLDKAFNEREFILVMLNVEPMFDPLRADPRFDDLSRRIGFIQ